MAALLLMFLGFAYEGVQRIEENKLPVDKLVFSLLESSKQIWFYQFPLL